MKPEMTKLAEIRNEQEEILWSIWLPAEQAQPIHAKLKGNGNPGNPKAEGKAWSDTSPGTNGEPMTYPQKRYLFRLLAERGIEGDAAYEHLKKEFGVNSLQQITKYEASQAIDQMLNG